MEMVFSSTPFARAGAPATWVGVSAKVTHTVGENDTALSLGSGDVSVLGTPRMIALCEEATCRALDGLLEPGQTSVATSVLFDHLAPVGVGANVVAEAALEKVSGRRLQFRVAAHASATAHGPLLAAGRVTRVIVNRDSFMAKASEPR
jgi:predicted thioesterase